MKGWHLKVLTKNTENINDLVVVLYLKEFLSILLVLSKRKKYFCNIKMALRVV